MRFHNNNVTIAIVSNDHSDATPLECFLVTQHKKGEIVEQVSLGQIQPSYTFDFGKGDLVIERTEGGEDVVGLICNTGIRQISLEYELMSGTTKAKMVGPSSDNIPMGQFREIGAGPNVAWHVTTFRGTAEKRHEELRK